MSLSLFDSLYHLTAIAISSIIALSVTIQRRRLRRTTRQSPRVFWLILLICILLMLGNGYSLLRLSHGADDTNHMSLLSAVIHASSVIAQGLVIMTLLYAKLVVERTRRPRRILAIGAHPDDIELACGATLAKLRDAGHLIQAVVLTNGERGGNAGVRTHEARRGASFLGCSEVQVHNFADTRLQTQANEILNVIEARVRAFEPDIIFTHSANDQHQDHQAVFEATLRAARNHSTILCYESPSVTRAFSPTFFVDIGDYVDIKIESVKEHNDQLRKPYISAERLRGIASFRGGQAKTRYAEGFEAVRSLSSALGDL